jgi:hypothetical protein
MHVCIPVVDGRGLGSPVCEHFGPSPAFMLVDTVPPTVAASASQDTLESLCTAEHSECLMCGSANPLGLKLRFRVQSDGSVVAMFACTAAGTEVIPGACDGVNRALCAFAA